VIGRTKEGPVLLAVGTFSPHAAVVPRYLTLFTKHSEITSTSEAEPLEKRSQGPLGNTGVVWFVVYVHCIVEMATSTSVSLEVVHHDVLGYAPVFYEHPHLGAPLSPACGAVDGFPVHAQFLPNTSSPEKQPPAQSKPFSSSPQVW
jgi:hypothetical protein